ncbi:hypothetical protein OCH239_09860 [Roseivivax halodurans JCM 10272]|uniref:HTH DNA binding domain-containing protein n=1 Tax=Roseivivax halodurans JCM 10272 TaxID=1449350 RepID=X7ECH3_9RHOB|nr:hypothetical protein [Roseivivax halodurans]ETX13575.1 hypothetical protein OCH239_09860 [Roseivivax halodurans JCM 10272]
MATSENQHTARHARTAFDLALGTEVAAARIEAALGVDPEIAAQWRSEIGVAEAVASVGLEDVRLSEPDLLIRVSENPGTGIGNGVEARAVEDALAILRFIRAPGDVASAPADVLDRIDRLAMRGEGDSDAIPGSELADIFSVCRGRAPILEAVRAAADYAWRTDRRSPVAERMVFMAAEHAARGQGAGAALRDTGTDLLRGLGGRFAADWICPPSLALTRPIFRAWSPGNPGMVRELLEALDRILSQELGRVITIRRWRARLSEVSAGRHGRSRLGEAGHAFGIEPFMTSRVLADRIGITQRGALNLLAQLVEEGLIVEMTRRRAARIWATPGLAAILAPAARRRAASARRTGPVRSSAEGAGEGADAAGPGPAEQMSTRNLRAEGQASMERAMAEFDRVLAEVDGILGRTRTAP